MTHTHDHDHTEGGECLVCAVGIDEYMRQAEDVIKRCGWMIVGLHGSDPAYFYTIGLCDLGLPELMLVLPVSMPTAGQIINLIGSVMKAGKFEVNDWKKDTDLFTGTTYFRELTPADVEKHCGMLINMRGEPKQMMQIVIPDKKGLFPWQPDCGFKVQEGLGFEYKSPVSLSTVN